MAKVALLIEGRDQESNLNLEAGVTSNFEVLKQVLQNPEVGDFTEVKVLNQPERLIIQQSIESIFRDRQKNDLVLLYFCGCGIRDERGKLYLTTQATRKDTQGKLVKSTAVPADFLQDVMDDSYSRQQVVILDCWVEGDLPSNYVKEQIQGASAQIQAQSTQQYSINIKQQLGGPGRAILTAGTAIQNDFQQNSPLAYTNYLIEGLETGAADLNHDGSVSLNELHQYVRRKLQNIIPSAQPEIYHTGTQQIVLAKAPSKHLRPRFGKQGPKLNWHRQLRPTGQASSPAEERSRDPALSTQSSMGVGVASPAAAQTTSIKATTYYPGVPRRTSRSLVVAGTAVLLLGLAGFVYALQRQQTVQALADQKKYEACLRQASTVPGANINPRIQNLIKQCQVGASWQSLQSQALTGHTTSVWSVALSPDGTTLASGSKDRTIKLWSLPAGKLLHTLSGHGSDVLSVAISLDGKTLASGSWDKTIKLWSLPAGKLLHTLSGHGNEVWSVALSPDGRTLASGSNDRTIKLWSLPAGKLLHTLSGHGSDVLSVAISPDGTTLASGSKDRTIKLWSLPAGKLLHTLSGHSGMLRSVAFSPDGQILASSSWDKTIRIWQLPTGKLVRTLAGHAGYVNSVAISSQGQILASGSDDTTVRLWNLHTGKLLRTLPQHASYVNSVVINLDSNTLASGSQDKNIKVVQRR